MPVARRVGKLHRRPKIARLRVVVQVSADSSATRRQVDREIARLRELMEAEYGPQYEVVIKEVQ